MTPSSSVLRYERLSRHFDKPEHPTYSNVCSKMASYIIGGQRDRSTVPLAQLSYSVILSVTLVLTIMVVTAPEGIQNIAAQSVPPS